MEEKLELMESFLKQDKPIFIYCDDFIDANSFEKLREMYSKYSKTRFKDCFEKIVDKANVRKEHNYFKFEYKCRKCGNLYQLTDSKTKLFYYIESPEKDLKCYECILEEQKELLEQRKKEQEQEKYFLEELEKDYQDNWLNPECSLVSEVYKKPWGARDEVKNKINYIGRETIKKYANSLNYKDYLKTPYWKLVSTLVKRKANYKCQLCGSEYDLNVHHRSYKHRGEEIFYLEDLIVLCFNCHQKFHDIGD